MTVIASFLKSLGVKGIAIIALILALVASLAVSRHRADKIQALTLEVGRLEEVVQTERANVAQRDDLISRQNAGVEALRKATEEAQRRILDSLLQANKVAAKQTDLAQQVLSRAPTNTEPCGNADDMLNEALAKAKKQGQ